MIGFFTTSFFKKSTSIVSRNYIYIFYSCTVCNVALSKPHASLSQKQFYFRIYIIWGGEIYKIARNRAFRMASLVHNNFHGHSQPLLWELLSPAKLNSQQIEITVKHSYLGYMITHIYLHFQNKKIFAMLNVTEYKIFSILNCGR